jgi:hypothetical protein
MSESSEEKQTASALNCIAAVMLPSKFNFIIFDKNSDRKNSPPLCAAIYSKGTNRYAASRMMRVASFKIYPGRSGVDEIFHFPTFFRSDTDWRSSIV